MKSTRLQDFRIADWLPPGVDVNTVIAFCAAFAVLVTFIAIGLTLRERNAFAQRLRRVVEQKETLRAAAISSRRHRPRSGQANLLREAVTRLNLIRSQHAAEARLLLARAGIRSQEAMFAYLLARVCLPPVFGAVMLMDTQFLHFLPIPPAYKMLAPALAVIIGFYVPRIFVKNAADKRAKQLQLGLPDGLDLMVVCAEAGLSLDSTLVRVARELGNTWPELAEEFAITAAELTFLPDRRQAFDNLNARTDSDGIRGVVNTLMQTAKFGTPLAQSLRVLAAEMRTLRMTRAEEKAARLPALLTVPMIVFILPTLFIVLLGPAAIGVMDTFGKP